MSLDRAAIRRLARLAMLDGPTPLLDDAACDALAREVSLVLAHVDALAAYDALPVDDVPRPAARDPLRDDLAQGSVAPARLLEGAPRTEGGALLVPKVLGG
jgi:Asp-tRNA(Asn)/Glu-tRNA(Gln) amidotransferase C subunit